jgi:hypothetical protein
VGCWLELADSPQCWSGPRQAESAFGKIAAWRDPSALVGVPCLDNALLVDRLLILTWCSPSEC